LIGLITPDLGIIPLHINTFFLGLARVAAGDSGHRVRFGEFGEKEISMDALLQLLIPDMKSLPGLERHQNVFTWEGKNHPQKPITYRWGPHVELIVSEVQAFILDLLPPDYRDKSWVVLEPSDDTLDLFEREANGYEVDWSGYRVDDLLILLMNQHERWVLIFEPQYDQIDQTCRLEATTALQKLKLNLKADIQKEGFIALPQV
jgi:hypothetical protein